MGMAVVLTAVMQFNSCVHKVSMPPPELPAYLQPLFSNCSGVDSVGGVRIFDGDRFLGSAEFEFRSDQADRWMLGVSDPVGPELLKFTGLPQHDGYLRVEGMLRDRIPEIMVSDTNFLLVDGNFTGIKLDEVSCLASFHFPQSWLRNLRAVTRVEGGFEGLVLDETRKIEMRFRRDSKGGNAESCAQIQSIGWLRPFRASWKWCIGGVGRPLVVLDGFRKYVIKWSSYDH